MINHPKKGSTIKVEPIKNKKDIATIRKLLADNPRNSALFLIGINLGLRAGDLLNLEVRQTRGLKTGDSVEIKEQKTGKLRRLTFNQTCVNAINTLLASKSFRDTDFLFQGQRSKRLTVGSLNRLVKTWTKTINLKGNYGSHSLRKTWGYMQRTEFNVDIPTLMVCLNHRTQRETLNYLCIQSEEIRDVYLNEI